ncbi:MAG: HlyD family efflux transporter periplasmic adaptor subunit [Pseudanabaena sp. ELA607]|jgi:HlyD family type I secretion membrane fusion protein
MENTELSTNTEFIIPLNNDEFLPPLSRWMTLGGFFLLGAVALTTGIAAITPAPVTVRAAASVRPDGDVKIIQSGVEGTVKKLVVKETEEVKQGQPIAIIDDSRLQTRKSQLEGSIQQGQLQLQQLDAQMLNLSNQIAAEQNLTTRTLASGQADLVRVEREYSDKREIALREVQEAEANMVSAKAESVAFETAAKDGGVPILQAEAKRQAYLAAQARLERAKTSLNPTNATISVVQEQLAQSEARGQSTTANLLKENEALQQRRAEIQNQINKDRKDLQQVVKELADVVIRAQADGTILKMALRNEGQVVRLGEVVAQISPKNAPLTIKARLAPQDIGEVRIGQRVNMRVSAYSYTDYGTLEGKVISIGADAIAPQSQDGNSANKTEAIPAYFEVTIQPDKTYLTKGNRQYEIQAGMEVQADIIGKEETVLTFVLRKAKLLVG